MLSRISSTIAFWVRTSSNCFTAMSSLLTCDLNLSTTHITIRVLTSSEFIVAFGHGLELDDVEGGLGTVHAAGEHLDGALLRGLLVLVGVVARLLDLVVDLLQLFQPLFNSCI